MNDQLKPALEAIQAQVVEKEREVILPLKQAANQLCKIMGIDLAYDLTDGASDPKAKTKSSWKIDQFFNKSLSGSVVNILTWKKESGADGPCTVDEIFDHLIKGGYKFEGSSGSDDNQKRALKIALTKNTAQFVKISEDVFGLRSWYGMRSPRNGKKPDDASGDVADKASEATAVSPSPEASPDPVQ